jgi:3-oxoacyl-[acyl-carrier protein] reductase
VAFTHWAAYDQSMPWGADQEGPAVLQQEIQELGVRAEQRAFDLAQPSTPARILDWAGEAIGPPSVLVNNAAHSTRDGYEALDAATLDAHYAVNVRGALLLSLEFARRYDGGPDGRIVFLTSGQSVGAMPDELAYAATKGATEAFVRSLAPAVATKGITVNAIDPGPTDSGWMTDEIKRELRSRAPLGRVGTPEDAASLVAFLASPRSGWITGQVIHSRGGL